MMQNTVRHTVSALAMAAAALVAGPAQAYSNLFVFGDSYSDTGNVGLALGQSKGVTQIIDNSYVPSAPFPTDGTYFPAVFSNGPAWPTSFAARLGLSAAPSLAGGTGFAFAGARVAKDGDVPALSSQVNMFLGSPYAAGGKAPSDALYVVAGIGNDARDALEAISLGAPLAKTIDDAVKAYASNMGNVVDKLQAAGAQKILVVSVGNIGLAPAVAANGPAASGLGTQIGFLMDAALDARMAGEANVTVFDSFAFLTGVAKNPAPFGFTNVSDACGGVAGADCSKYFFWDGLHPTGAGHQLLSNALFTAVIPEPSTYALFAFGLAAVGLARRRAKASA